MEGKLISIDYNSLERKTIRRLEMAGTTLMIYFSNCSFHCSSTSTQPGSMEKEANQVNPPQTNLKCSTQWRPVHDWLETLNKREVVKSTEISDWLCKNPKVKEDLYSRYSRCHLMHYIQKCHNRILKRRAKGKGVQHPNVTSPMKVNDNGPKKLPVPPQGISSSNIPRDNNLARRNEAFRKFVLLTELESRLSTVLSKSKQAKGLEDFSMSSSHGKTAENIKHDKSYDLDDEEGRTGFMSVGAPDKDAATNQDLGLDNQ